MNAQSRKDRKKAQEAKEEEEDNIEADYEQAPRTQTAWDEKKAGEDTRGPHRHSALSCAVPIGILHMNENG